MSEFDSRDAEQLQQVEDWQQEELDRRRARFQANPDSGLSWQEVQSRVRRGHQGASG